MTPATIETRKPLIVSKASAGSGKTYTLAYEYIKLTLGHQGPDGRWQLAGNNIGLRHRSILAVTFTNKATREMKERIVARLGELARGKGPYRDSLIALFGCSPQELATAADKALHGLLFDFSNFNVSTLDSFFQSLLRAFVTEVGQSGNYNIELNDQMVVEQGVRMILQNIHSLRGDSNNERTRRWIESCIRDAVKHSEPWNIFKRSINKGSKSVDLYRIAGFITSETYKEKKDEIKQYFTDNDGTNIERYTKAVKLKREELEEQTTAAVAEVVRLIESDKRIAYNKTAVKTIAGIADDIIAAAGKTTTNITRVKQYAFDDNVDRLFWANKPTKDAYERGVADIVTLVDSIIDALKKASIVFTSFNFYLHTGKYIYALGLLSDIIANVEQYQRDNDTLLLSNTGDILKAVITGTGDAPFVYERTGLRLRHFLIDEFQDTSRLQWDNMRPLVTESLGYGNENLIIGDVKQSIYRFRNADSSLLHSGLDEQLGDLITRHNLEVNYRSTATVVNFNNSFIRLLITEISKQVASQLITDTYADMEQKVSGPMRKEIGYVSLKTYTASDAKEGDDAEAVPAQDEPQEEKKDINSRRLDDMLAIIRDCLQRGYRQRDIGILTNRNDEGVAIVDYIIANAPDIRIVSDESLLLRRCPSVEAIINMLSLYENLSLAGDDEEDAERKANATSNQRSRDRHIFNVMMHFNRLISQGMSRTEAILEATKDQQADDVAIDTGNALTLYQIVEQLIASLPADARKRHNIYLTAFQDTVADYSRRYLPSINAFLQWWKDNCEKLTVVLPAADDAVNVMTIHKAKGLEFGCVIIPMADWKLTDSEFFAWSAPAPAPDGSRCEPEPPMLPLMLSQWTAGTAYEKEWRDNVVKETLDCVNKTYVAFTRAVRELYVMTKNNGDTTIFKPISEFIKANAEEGATEYTVGEKTIRPAVADIMAGQARVPDYEISSPRSMTYRLPELEMDHLRRHGTMLHKLMSYITTPADVDKAVAIAASQAMIPTEERQSYLSDITAWISDPRVAPWFAPENRVITERDISIGATAREAAHEQQHRRPDRIVIAPDGSVTVVDYKFGEGGSDAATHPRYVKQIQRYINLLHDSGFTTVKGYIWYLLTGEVCEVN